MIYLTWLLKKRGYVCCNSSYLLFKAIANQFARLNEYFKVLFNAKCKRICDKRFETNAA